MTMIKLFPRLCYNNTYVKDALSISISGAKNVAIWHHKSYFIYFTISFYKAPNINSFILIFNTIK